MPPSQPVPSARAPQGLRVGFAGLIGRGCFGDLLLRADTELEPAFSSASRRSLLAQLAAGELDAAVYPGAPSPGAASARLCRDRLALATAPGHAPPDADRLLADGPGARPLLLPADGDEGEFRRLVRALLPALGPTEDVPGRDLPRRLAQGGAALVAASTEDELGDGLLFTPLRHPRAQFEVQISWTRAAAAGAFGRLLPPSGV